MSLRTLSLLPAIGITLCCAWLVISQDGDANRAEIAVLNEGNWTDFAPHGKEVDAIYGDVVLRNRHLSAVIADVVPTRNANMTVRDVAGCLIDLTSREFQSDQLSCFYPGQRQFGFRQRTYSVGTGESRSLEPGTVARGKSVSTTVVAAGTGNRPTVAVTYSLGDEDRYLTMTVSYTNPGSAPIKVDLIDDIRADGGKEEMVKSENGTTSLFTIEDQFWQQAYGVRCADRSIQCNSNARTSELKYADADGKTTIELAPGATFERVCRLACGRTLLHVTDALAPTSTPPTTVQIQDGLKRPLDQARVEVRQGNALLSTARTDVEGKVSLPLIDGTYSLRITHHGFSVGGDKTLTVAESANRQAVVTCDEYRPGDIEFKVVDQTGTAIPCKVEFRPAADAPVPNFGPESAEFGVKNLRYAPHGRGSQSLPPGSYSLTFSHGPEFDAVFETVEVKSGESTPVSVTLKRSVDTSGWVSSDFHSHSTPSGDNTSSQLGRVLNLVCEHLEFAPCTEHNRVDTYQHHFDALKIGKFISSTTGMELTGSPLPLNHQNVFPLHHHPHRQDGGGPQTDTDVEKQVQRVAAWDDGSEKLVQQNHPDIGWLFYDKDGDGQSDRGHADGVALIDVMEIHPIEKLLTLGKPDGVSSAAAKGNRLFRWLQLLNQGYRIPGVVNTDAHYNFHGSGWLRNWIQSSTDDPARIDVMQMVHASEQGRIVMSNGPFLQVTAKADGGSASATVGQDLAAPAGKVALNISVQCPNWIDVDTVFVLVNGRAREDLLFTRKSHPEKFGDGPVKFRQSVTVTLEKDAHLVVGTGDADSTLEKIYGAESGKVQPSALGNPIFVDVDGGGFTPNKDTLGLPLPVKGE